MNCRFQGTCFLAVCASLGEVSHVPLDRLVTISLDRTPERFQRFVERNGHVPITRFSAVDGRALDREACIAEGLITADNLYTPGALGSAASHVALWRSCIDQGQPMHIAEDDAIVRGDFLVAASHALAQLSTWDCVLWGWNFDWPLKLRMAPGLGSSVLESNQDELRRDWKQFTKVESAPLLARLISCSGTCCYSISPEGARRLLDRVLPVGNKPAAHAIHSQIAVANMSLDMEMSRHFETMEAYVAVPCLAVSLNLQGESTIYHN